MRCARIRRRILIDAGGYIVGQYVGEGYAEEIDADVATAIGDAKKKES